ncbi:TonB-dependent receptor domain-containing protein [Stakelama marina]|uniref:TonB-dependent receptor n=1 Tax=Stakelama marina TaxID=2826939 RepID=A0A8T4II35_9SPHN|nr:TonB-dependent receptor [Stakelama marina]MBR0551959.1 TonB-dependent receptor [Stakelama marina]
MKTMPALARLLLASSALIAPVAAHAQSTTTTPPPSDTTAVPTPAPEASQAADDAQQQTDVSIPGAAIVVTGRRNANIERSADQVVSVLSSEDIARTGEGDIAGALSHVTGLSVVGNGYVYVRGLGDRYSLALLNGLPLPSPQPLKRAVPLDIFPSTVIASAFVQKSYSANFPGEFGGGVINLTTDATPKESFLDVGGSIGGDTITTGQLGYTYFGSPWDWTGFDNGQRDTPPALRDFISSGEPVTSYANKADVAKQLVLGRTAVVQRNKNIPINTAANITGGTSVDIGATRLGILASAGYSNDWRTRETLQQTAQDAALTQPSLSYDRVITDNHIVANGLLGFGLEFGRNKIRWTNLYIRDTLKQARIASGRNNYENLDSIIQDTAWFERQLIDSQLVGEFKFDPVDVDVRIGYANSKRRSPYETSFTYSKVRAGPYEGLYVNVLDNSSGAASVAFSRLNENLWSGGLDFTIDAAYGLKIVTGMAYTDSRRTSTRYNFGYSLTNRTPDGFGNFQNPGPVSLFRPDYLLEPTVIDYYGVVLNDLEPNSAFNSSFTNQAAYIQGKWQANDAINLDVGVRFETAKQLVTQANSRGAGSISNKIDKDYWLPSATLTWALDSDMQVRLSASKTIARPQFRELLYQLYYDPEANRTYTGNPFLVDSQLYNAEARYEWYFARDQHVSLAGFYKRIDKPIEQYLFLQNDTEVRSSFGNAPKADLYGAEFELQKYFNLFDTRRIALNANYTYSHSVVKVADGDTTINNNGTVIPATNLFLDGRPLTGQSDHVANLQIGLEDKADLSQQTFILNYASKRLTARGPQNQPDIYEYPGFTLDFVARQAVHVAGINFKLKLDIRNITGTKYKEYQQSGDNRIYWNRYKRGTSGTIGLSLDL